MPGYIIIDTEGTGLFQHSKVLEDGTKVTIPSDAPGQPRMAEYAHVLLNDDFEIEAEYQQYVVPVGWQNADGTPMLEMPPEAYAVHGLSMDFLRARGEPIRHILSRYEAAILDAKRVVIGFNQQHDGRQVRAELRHNGRPDLFELSPNICAMRSITANYKGRIKKTNGKGGFPRLQDAAAHFGFYYPDDRRHTALEDARVTALVARALHDRDLLLPAAVHYSAHHPSNLERATEAARMSDDGARETQ
jgi:DNA polymerase-3 subunit epsilon